MQNTGIRPESIAAYQTELARLIEKNTVRDGTHPTAIPSLFLLRSSNTAFPSFSVHEPAICIIAQGAKVVMLGEESFTYGPFSYLVVSLDLPVSAQVIQATPESPYLCIRLKFDPSEVLSLIDEAAPSNLPNLPNLPNFSSPSNLSNLAGHADFEDASGPSGPFKKSGNAKCGLFVDRTSPSLLEAAIRLVKLAEQPEDVPVLAPLMIKELLYRVLRGAQGSALRQIAVGGSTANRIARVVKQIKQQYDKPLHIEELAALAHMAPSSLHRHFKEVTAMSPLQYQKQLRLQEARRILLSDSAEAADVAFQVGYESPSQFSREYSRLFGLPPISDIKRLRGELG